MQQNFFPDDTFKTAILPSLDVEINRRNVSNKNEEPCFRDPSRTELDDDEESQPYSSFDGVSNVLRFPSSVNIVTLRETLISSAPFITRSNRSFWRKWLDTKQFIQVAAGSYQVVASSFQENGTVNGDILFNVCNNPLVDIMASNFAELFFMNRLYDRDILFKRLPEILSYMIINALNMSIHKFHRVYNSTRFRELLLDWSSELVGGIKFSHIQKNREWLFNDAADTSIVINKCDPLRNVIGVNIPSHMQGAMRSTYKIENSPLLSIYMDPDRNRNRIKMALALSKQTINCPLPLSNTNNKLSKTNENYESLHNNNDNRLLRSSSNNSEPQLITNSNLNTQSSSESNNSSLRFNELSNVKSLTSLMSLTSATATSSNVNFCEARSPSNKITTKEPTNKNNNKNNFILQQSLPARKYNLNSVKITLTNLPGRALMSMNLDNLTTDEAILFDGKIREKKADVLDIRKTVRNSVLMRKESMLKYHADQQAVKEEVKAMHETLKTQIRTLSLSRQSSTKNIVSKKEILESIRKKYEKKEINS